MAHVPAGELNKRIQIIRKTGEKDSDGYDCQPDQELIRSCWAKLTRTSGTELVKANADFSQVKVRFLIRWTNVRLSRRMVVRYDGDDYEIKYVNDYEDAHQYIELWCERQTLGD